MKLLYPKWLSGQVRDGQYIDAQDNWAIYKQKAYAEAIMPSTPSEWEAILHEYTRLVPDLNSADTQQGLLGDQELIHNQNRHFYLNNQNRFSIEF
jgi:NADH:ubiquinone oxidoreductase subunit